MPASARRGHIQPELTPYAADRPPHHTPKGFRNLHIATGNRVIDFFRWQLGRGPQEEPAVPPEELPPCNPRVFTPDPARLQNPDQHRIQLTWIGHSTFLVQFAGLNLLTDPVFSERASPVPGVGPKRRVPPGVPWQALPPIQAVVISHNHYDHLDAAVVKQLGNRPGFFVPLGLGDWFRKTGIHNLVELDWWQSAVLGPLRFHSVPAQHFSMRTPFDQNKTLWAGYVIESPVGNVFFSCDTGYSPDFQEIGRRLGPMRLALIPIGGYMPRWFMRPMHVNPVEAVQIHQDLRAEQSVGMHWGTFKLSDEPLSEPPVYLQRALKQAGISPERFIVLGIGETRTFG